MVTNRKQSLVPASFSLSSTRAISLPPASTREVVSSTERLPERLTNLLWSELPLPSSGLKPTRSDSIVRSYNASIESLQVSRQDVNDFLRKLCDFQVEVDERGALHPNQLQQAASREASQFCESAVVPEIRVSRRLQAELFAQSPAEILACLTDDLAEATQIFVAEFLEAFEILAAQCVVGHIEWPIDTACRYRYFNRCMSEHVATTEVINDHHSRFTRVTKKGEITFEVTVWQQHLAMAVRQPLTSYESLIPIRIRTLLDAIPPWLRGEFEIVEGDLFRSDTAKRSYKMDWREEATEWWPTIEPSSDTKLSYYADPVVTLGRYVLCAWQTEEQEAERHEIKKTQFRRRQQVALQKNAVSMDAFLILAVTILLQVVPLTLHLVGISISKHLHLVGFAISLALLLPLHYAIEQDCLARRIRYDLKLAVPGFASAVFAVLAWQAALFGVSYGLGLAFLASTIFVGVACFFGKEYLTTRG